MIGIEELHVGTFPFWHQKGTKRPVTYLVESFSTILHQRIPLATYISQLVKGNKFPIDLKWHLIPVPFRTKNLELSTLRIEQSVSTKIKNQKIQNTFRLIVPAD